VKKKYVCIAGVVILALCVLAYETVASRFFSEPIEAIITPTEGVAGSNVTFSCLVTPAYTVTSWDWDFGGGAIPPHSSLREPLETLSKEGTYSAYVRIKARLWFLEREDGFSFLLRVKGVHTALTETANLEVEKQKIKLPDKYVDVRAMLIDKQDNPALLYWNGDNECIYSQRGDTEWIKKSVSSDIPVSANIFDCIPYPLLLVWAGNREIKTAELVNGSFVFNSYKADVYSNDYVSAATDKSGAIHLFVVPSQKLCQQLLHLHLVNGVMKSEIVDGADRIHSAPQCKVSSDGKIHLLYIVDTRLSEEYEIRYSSYDGNRWHVSSVYSGPIRPALPELFRPSHPVLSVSQNGRIAAAAVKHGYLDIAWRASGSWEYQTFDKPVSGLAAPCIEIDDKGCVFGVIEARSDDGYADNILVEVYYFQGQRNELSTIKIDDWTIATRCRTYIVKRLKNGASLLTYFDEESNSQILVTIKVQDNY